MNSKLPTLLFVPPLENRFWQKLGGTASKLGGIILDLEDSIHATAKELARQKILQNLDLIRTIREQHRHFRVIIRVNNLRAGYFSNDLKLVHLLSENSDIDAIMYPKPETPDEIDQLYNSIDTSKIAIFATIETLLAYDQYVSIIRPERGVKWSAVGAEDLCADMNIERPIVFYSNPLLERIAVDIALKSKLRGIGFWGNIWPYLRSPELLPYFFTECILDQMIGAVGKICFHPYQIDIVNSIFDPKLKNENQTHAMLGRLSTIAMRAKEKGLTVAVHNNRMIDMPEMVRLRRWLESIEDEEIKKLVSSQVDEFTSFLLPTRSISDD